MKYLIIVLAFLSAMSATAGDILVGQYTYHFDKDTRSSNEYIDTHPLIGYSSENYTVIAMRNTYKNTSVAALYTYRYEINSNVTLASSFGAASGYKQHDSKCKAGEVICVAYLSAEIHPKSNDYGIVITFAPGVFIGAGLKINID